MKYSRLSKEQFESLHQEFINFLATQQITAAEWDTLKTTQPEVVFSRSRPPSASPATTAQRAQSSRTHARSGTSQ